MSLSAAEARALTRIETALLARDPRLRSLFSIFTRLTRQEAMPAREQLRRRSWLRRRTWPPQPGVVIALALALALAMVVMSAMVSPQRACAPVRVGSPLVQTTGHGCAAGTPPVTPTR